MKVYKCVFTEDELFSDSYPIQLKDDAIYEVTGQQITICEKFDDALIGANASTEEPENQDSEATKISGINVVINSKLITCPFIGNDKGSFKTYIKSYMSTLKERLEQKNPGRVSAFVSAMESFVKSTILPNWDNIQFYSGEQGIYGGMPIAALVTDSCCKLYFFKDGVREEKY